MSNNYQIVISRFKEDVRWADKLNSPFVIYDKGGDLGRGIQLPNAGREAQTYIYHIVKNYDSLLDYTVFLQGNPHQHADDVIKTINEFDTRYKYKDLVLFGEKIAQCDNQGYFLGGSPMLQAKRRIGKLAKLWLNPKNSMPIEKCSAALFGRKFNSYFFTCGAQFIVPRENILHRPKSFYEKILNLDWDSDQWPWVMERLWFLVFDKNIEAGQP